MFAKMTKWRSMLDQFPRGNFELAEIVCDEDGRSYLYDERASFRKKLKFIRQCYILSHRISN